MFDNGSLLRRRKRFKTAAKQRSAQLAEQNNTELKSQSTDQVEQDADFSDYEGEYSESDDEFQDSSKAEEKQVLLTQKNLTPQEMNEMFLISNNFKSNHLIDSPIMVNIPNGNESLSALSSNLSECSPTKQLTPKHASSPNENTYKHKNSSLFSIDCLIGENSSKTNLGIQSHVIKKAQKQPKKKLANKKFVTDAKDSNLYNITKLKSNTSCSTLVDSHSRIESRSSNSSNSRSCSPDANYESTAKHFKPMNSFVTPNPMLNMFQNPNLLNDPQNLAAMRIRNSLSFLYSPLTNGGLPLECSPTSSSLSTTQGSLSSNSSSSSSFSCIDFAANKQNLELSDQYSSPIMNKNQNIQKS